MDLVQTLGVSLLVLYLLVRDVIGPLVKKLINRDKDAQEGPTQTARLTVLEVDLGNVRAQLVDFERALEEAGKNLDNKLDMVLAELAELRNETAEAHRMLGERIRATEVHIEHMRSIRGRD